MAFLLRPSTSPSDPEILGIEGLGASEDESVRFHYLDLIVELLKRDYLNIPSDLRQ